MEGGGGYILEGSPGMAEKGWWLCVCEKNVNCVEGGGR